MLIRIARPCSEHWDEMAGDDRARHCARCDKPVHDVAAMSVAEVRALQARGTPWCGRVYLGVGLAIANAGCSVICGSHHPGSPSTPVAVAPAPPEEPDFTPAPSPPDTYRFLDDDPELYMLGEIDTPVDTDQFVPAAEPDPAPDPDPTDR